MTISDRTEVERLYQLLQVRCDAIARRFGGRLPTPAKLASVRTGSRSSGVYFFFENGELRSTSEAPRVVRVGTHTGSKSTIESRIVGEHATDWGRSVFRRHIGTALIRRGALDNQIAQSDRDRWAQSWNSKCGRSAVHHLPKHLHPTLHPLHGVVTQTVGTMPVVWVEISDRVERRELEKQCIRLLSNHLRSDAPIDPPSVGWLGRHALAEQVRLSGLWNVHNVTKQHGPGFLDHFARYFEQ
jgi:hypothetical protein